MAYPTPADDEADEPLNDAADSAMDDATPAPDLADPPSLTPALPRRLRKLSNASSTLSPGLPPWLFADIPRPFSHWSVTENDGLYYQELVNFFGQQGGFHLLLSSLPLAPPTTYRFLISRAAAVADIPILTPAEQSALQQASDRPSLLYVRDVLGLLHALIGKPASGLQLRIVLLFVARVVAYCLSLTDAQLQRESKQHVSDVVTLCTLLAGLQHTLPLASHMERYESDFSLYLLRCASLEKRIHGLSHIKRLLEVEQERRLGLSAHGAIVRPLMDHSSPPYSRPIASSFVLLPSYTRYLQKAAVIETLFGEGLHVQLLRRSTSLLRCMAQQQCLSTQQLDCMWAATRGKHETVAAQVYGCITAVITALPWAGLQHLFDRLSAVSVGEMDVQFVALARCVVAAALDLHHPSQHHHGNSRFEPAAVSTDTESLPARGLDFFWRLFNERQLPVDSLRQAAFEHLQALLLSDAAAAFRHFYSLRCVDNVKRQWNVPHALWLLHDITETYGGQSTTTHTPNSAASASSSAAPHTSPFKQLLAAGAAVNTATTLASTPRHIGLRRIAGVDERSTVLESLNTDNALLKAFFLELSAFAAQPSGVPGVFVAAKAFEMRLVFLEYVYRHSKLLSIDYATVAMLWSHFISPLPNSDLYTVLSPPSFDAECRDVLFNFLTSTFNSTAIDPSLPSLVFHQLVPLLPFTTLSQAGFMLFQLLFVTVNRAEGKLTSHSATPFHPASSGPLSHGPTSSLQPAFTVRCPPTALSGFQHVWELACVCATDEVGNEATRMLQRMHGQVEASGVGGLSESYEWCVARAMERIVRVRAELEEASGERKSRLGVEMERCFNILNILLDQPHYSNVAVFNSTTSSNAVSNAVSPASVSLSSSSSIPEPSAPSLPASVAAEVRLLTVAPTQRCRPPNVCGALLYLSQDYPPPRPGAPSAYPITVTVNYPLTDFEMGQFDVSVSSYATMDDLVIAIQRQSTKEPQLVELAHDDSPPFPFPLLDVCEFGSDESLTTRMNRRKRVGELAPPPNKTGEEAKWEVKLRCKSEDSACLYDPTHVCPACAAALPLWVYRCRCGHDERLDQPPANQRVWSEARAMVVRWETEIRALQLMAQTTDPFPLTFWPGHAVPAYPLPTRSVWRRNEEDNDWPNYDDVNFNDAESQELCLVDMHGLGEATSSGEVAARLADDTLTTAGGGLMLVLRRDKEGEFSAGEMESTTPSDTDTDARPTAQRQDSAPPMPTLLVVHPSVILSRVEYVDELFKLLAMSGSDSQLSEKCWQLLMRLDINSQLLHALNEAQSHWLTLLDARNIAKLQYALIIVRMLMHGHAHSASAATNGAKVALRLEVDTASEQRQRAGDEWQRRFLVNGGVSFLLGALQEFDILADAIPLQQPSTQPSASALSFHQSLALQCVMSLLVICTDILRNTYVNPVKQQRREPLDDDFPTSLPSSNITLSPVHASPPTVAAELANGSSERLVIEVTGPHRRRGHGVRVGQEEAKRRDRRHRTASQEAQTFRRQHVCRCTRHSHSHKVSTVHSAADAKAHRCDAALRRIAALSAHDQRVGSLALIGRAIGRAARHGRAASRGGSGDGAHSAVCQLHIRHFYLHHGLSHVHRLTHHRHRRTRSSILISHRRPLPTVPSVRSAVRPAPRRSVGRVQRVCGAGSVHSNAGADGADAGVRQRRICGSVEPYGSAVLAAIVHPAVHELASAAALSRSAPAVSPRRALRFVAAIPARSSDLRSAVGAAGDHIPVGAAGALATSVRAAVRCHDPTHPHLSMARLRHVADANGSL